MPGRSYYLVNRQVLYFAVLSKEDERSVNTIKDHEVRAEMVMTKNFPTLGTGKRDKKGFCNAGSRCA